ncbi:MAG: UTP--glucose-1-phosphate uridylyltransferase GalU [Rhodobacteraceae bacterium]|nr:UTP--glucose-1-phosphate uridylyltransferase GalU [Paracoccaceae bacterium]
MRKVTKAVFPVAGLGTRFLPATKAMPKELLPIIDKPIIQYAVEEAIAAGITDMIFVTGRTKRAIEDHFDRNPELEASLGAKGKDDVREMVRSIIPEGINCVFVRQPEALGLGHAVLCAAPVVGDEPFAVLLADDFMAGELLPTEALCAAYGEHGRSVISVSQVPGSEVSKYGIISTSNNDAGALKAVTGIVEKPEQENAPSNLASIGRYVFSSEIFEILRDQQPGHGGEIQLADAINTLAEKGRVLAQCITGARYDCGSKFGYLEAIVDAALAHDEYSERFREMLIQRISRREAAE